MVVDQPITSTNMGEVVNLSDPGTITRTTRLTDLQKQELLEAMPHVSVRYGLAINNPSDLSSEIRFVVEVVEVIELDSLDPPSHIMLDDFFTQLASRE